MKITDLYIKLKELEVDSNAYSLNGEVKDESYILEPDPRGGVWFFYSERGLRTGERFFDKESEATIFLLDVLLSDRTVSRKQTTNNQSTT